MIYRKEKVPRIEDMWTKLWGETERSVALAHLLREEAGVHVEQIDLDFNTGSRTPLQQTPQRFGGIHSIAGVPKWCQARPADGGMGC